VHLTIGITGHRNLVAEEVPALKLKVRELFLQLRKEYPDLTLQLVTPLAEGADRLAADVAMSLGIELVIVLPMPQADYEEDFSSPEAVAQLRESLDGARVIQLPQVPSDKETAGVLTDRQLQYAQLGVFVSNHCQILLALWDGKATKEVAGTAGVVNYHLFSIMPGYSIVKLSPNLLANNENDLCYHISCSRDQPDGQPEAGLKPLESAWLTAAHGRSADNQMPTEYATMLHRLQDYDIDTSKYLDQIKAESFDLLHIGIQKKAVQGIRANQQSNNEE